MRDGSWRRERGYSACRPDPRHFTALMRQSMTSPAGGVYLQITFDLRAPVDQRHQHTAPGNFWWVQGFWVTAWGPRLSPAPPHHLWLTAPKPPALLCRAAAAVCRARAGLRLQLTALLKGRPKASLPLPPPFPVYLPPPPPPLCTLPMPPRSVPHSHSPLRGRSPSPLELWNKTFSTFPVVWMNHLCSVSLSLHNSKILCK